MNPAFLKPRYDTGGFAGIPNRIKEAFASGSYDAVVLFLVDGFGWRFFERFQDTPFIKRIARDGTIEKLTSQFPSTTAAHLTTIHTGLPVGVCAAAEYRQAAPMTLDHDQILVILSDGVIEAARAGGEQFGLARVLETIQAHREQSAPRLAELIHQEA